MKLGVHPIANVADELHLPPEIVEVADVAIAVQEDPERFLALGRAGRPLLSGCGRQEGRVEQDREGDHRGDLDHG